MFDSIKNFHLGYNKCESLFLSTVVSLSIFIILQVITLLLGYNIGNLFMADLIFAFLSTFLISYFMLDLMKPKFYISKNKKLLLILQFLFTLSLIYLIL